MQDHHVSKIAEEMNLLPGQVFSTAQLLDGGATVPFIARYRKEVTGTLDEVAITTIRDRIAQLQELEKGGGKASSGHSKNGRCSLRI